MDWSRIAPWNWFKEEQEATSSTRRPTASLARRSYDPFSALRAEIDRLFEGATSQVLAGRSSAASSLAPLRPSVDISETKTGYTIRAELPGMDRDDVSIEVHDRTLVLRGEKRQEREQEEEGYHCVERVYGAVQRVISLPDDADAGAVDAKFRNGVLTLRIGKAAGTEGRQRIEVKPG